MARPAPLFSRQLLAFVAVAEELHFGRAAERLNISQPPLSQQIRQFEKDVGTTLFVRTTRSVQLTPAGRELLDAAHRLLEQGGAAIASTHRVAAGEIGMLSLGFTSAAAVQQMLPRAISAYRKRFPEMRLTLHEQNSSQLWDGLLSGRLDVALMRRQASMSDTMIRFLPVGQEPLGVAMPAGHRLAHKARIAMDDLRDEELVTFAQSTSGYFHALIGGLFTQAGIHPRIAHESVLPTMLSLVEAGVGIALIPRSAAAMRPGRLVFRPLHARGAVARLYVALRRGTFNSAAAAFADIARAGAVSRPARPTQSG
jgi:DNA-binding transcriptional LysR family regulator